MEAGVLYRRYHCPDGTTLYLQVVVPVKLRRPYIERLHAGTFRPYQNLYVSGSASVLPGGAFAHRTVSADLSHL